MLKVSLFFLFVRNLLQLIFFLPIEKYNLIPETENRMYWQAGCGL